MVFKKMQGDGWAEPITTMGLEGVVSSVAEKMLPEINKTTEIIYFKDWTQLKVATSS